jgi:hypothetical protein
MPRFGKPPASKKNIPFQREVPPPSPPAGTPKGVNPMSVLQSYGAGRMGNLQGGFGTIAEYAKSLEPAKSWSPEPKDRRAILEKLLVGSPEQAKALTDAAKPYRSGNQYLMPSGLSPIADTVAFGRRGWDALAGSGLGELLGLGGATRTVEGKGSLVDAAQLPLNWLGTLQAAGAIGKLPKGTIPKVLQAGGMYGAGSIDPKTRKMLQKFIGNPVSKVWDAANTPIADFLP